MKEEQTLSEVTGEMDIVLSDDEDTIQNNVRASIPKKSN